MGKSADAFRTISEVADWLGVQAHVLRFWESKFTQIKPVKRAGGRRYYRPNDMRLIGGIKHLLHDDGLTIKGVQKLLRDEGVAHVAGFSKDLDDISVADDTAKPAATKKKAQSKPTPATTPDTIEGTIAQTPDVDEAPFVDAEEEKTEAEVVQFAASKPDETPEIKIEADQVSAPAEPPAAEKTPDTPAIKMPELPPLDDSAPNPGVLSHAFACKSLSATDAKAIEPWLARLQTLRDQMASQRR